MLRSLRLRGRDGAGFTLIEVLVVVAIIALLLAILLPSLASAKEQAKRVACQSNLRSMGQAMTFYSEDHSQNYFMFNHPFDFNQWRWGKDTIGGDSVVALALNMTSVGRPGTPGYQGANSKGSPHRRYIRDWSVLICPGTKNQITRAGDLNGNADSREHGASDAFNGHSYEFWNGFQKYDFAGPGSALTGITGAPPRLYTGRDDDTDSNGFPDCLKRPTIVAKRAASVILVLDGDDRKPGNEDLNNWPDSPLGNQMTESACCSACRMTTVSIASTSRDSRCCRVSRTTRTGHRSVCRFRSPSTAPGRSCSGMTRTARSLYLPMTPAGRRSRST